MAKFRFRSAITGRFLKKAQALRWRKTSVKEKVKGRPVKFEFVVLRQTTTSSSYVGPDLNFRWP